MGGAPYEYRPNTEGCPPWSILISLGLPASICSSVHGLPFCRPLPPVSMPINIMGQRFRVDPYKCGWGTVATHRSG